MKTFALVLAATLAATSSTSNTAEARHRVLVPVVRPYVLTTPRVIVHPVHPLLAPGTTTVIAPGVIIGPRGHVHYVTLMRPLGTRLYIHW